TASMLVGRSSDDARSAGPNSPLAYLSTTPRGNPLFEGVGAGLFKSPHRRAGDGFGSDNIGACLKVLFIACSALFIVLFIALLLLEDGRARARARVDVFRRGRE